MALTINLQDNINNVSLQIGDTAYFVRNLDTSTSITNAFDSNITTNPLEKWEVPKKIGEITEIQQSYITIANPTDNTPTTDDFIMFSKDKRTNNTSLLGYYAEVKLSNNSTDKAELFTLSSEIAPSSK